MSFFLQRWAILSRIFPHLSNIRFQKEDGEHDYAYQTCYGLSTRVLAAVIGVHGDDRGLIIPPYLAPLQVIIVPILFKGKEEIVDKLCKEVLEELRDANITVRYDDSDKTSGYKFNEYELQGVPVRIEIGPKDVEKGGVTIARRDTKERMFIEKSKIIETVRKTFDQITEELKLKAKKLLDDSISDAATYEELEEKFAKSNPGFVRTNWCGDVECADLIKDKLKADIRGTLYGEDEETFGPCIICTEKAEDVVYISRAY